MGLFYDSFIIIAVFEIKDNKLTKKENFQKGKLPKRENSQNGKTPQKEKLPHIIELIPKYNITYIKEQR